MTRKRILVLLGSVCLALMLVVMACAAPTPTPTPAPTPTPSPPPEAEIVRWTMQMELPAACLAGERIKARVDRIMEVSGGRLDIDLHYPGEIVPGYSEYKAVKEGVLDIGYGGSYQWMGDLGIKVVLLGGTGFPGGPTPGQNLAWFYIGDGLKLANEVLGDWGKVISLSVGSTELFCHSNVKLETADAFKGVKFRTMGPWGEILTTYYGASVVTITGGEIYEAADRGVIDAFEYCPASINWPMGFHEVTKYIGIPGIHSPGAGSLVIVNNASWDALPDDLKGLLADEFMTTGYQDLNLYEYEDSVAIQKYKEYGIEFFTLSDEFQQDITAKSKEFFMKEYEKDPVFKKLWDNLEEFISTYREQDVVNPQFSVFG